jgi:hypothetical protein
VFFTAFARIFFYGRKIRESFKDLKELHAFFETSHCLLQSLIDLSDFQNDLNDAAFCNNLSQI